jgi:type VI secretion system protein VasI
MISCVPGRLTRNTLIFLAIVAASLMPAAPALAQQDAAACAAIADDGERLACYDGIFRPTGDIEPGGEAIILNSERMIPARPTGRGLATMTVACGERGIGVAFAFAGQLVSNTGDIAPITFQVDAGASTVRTLSADSANTTLSFASVSEAEAFLNAIEGGTNLKVRMTPVRLRSLNVDFRLEAVADQLAALRSNCG